MTRKGNLTKAAKVVQQHEQQLLRKSLQTSNKHRFLKPITNNKVPHSFAELSNWYNQHHKKIFFQCERVTGWSVSH